MKKYRIAAVFIVLAVFILNTPMQIKFTISNGNTGEIVYIDEVDNTRDFIVSFRHSVNRTPVNEFIRIEDNKFIVYKTTFYSYGAGMPEYDGTGKQKVTIENGIVQIDNIDRELESFTYMVGTYADHVFSCGGRHIRLSDLIEPQNPALFRICKVTPFELIVYHLRRK